MFELVQLSPDARPPTTTTATTDTAAAPLSLLLHLNLLLVLHGGILQHLHLHQDGLQLSRQEVSHDRSGRGTWSSLAIPVLQLIVTLKHLSQLGSDLSQVQLYSHV